MFMPQTTDEEIRHRRHLTDFAVKLTLLTAAVGLALELFFCSFVLSPDQRTLDRGLHLLMSVTTVMLGFLAIMLGMNRLKKIPHWVVSSLFLLALIFLILCSDTPQQLIDGGTTMFFMVPILLSGVLVHSYATFIFTSLVAMIFAAYTIVSPGLSPNPLTLIFFYMFSGLVSLILRNLERSAYQLCRAAAQSETILSALQGGYILTDRNYRILRLNESTSSVFPLAGINSNLLDVIKDTNLEIDNVDLEHLTSMITGVEAGEVRVKICGKHYCAENKYIPASKDHLIFLWNITAEVEIDRLKDTALAMVSHELRTPLTAIRGHAERALREPITAVANVTRILLNAQRLLIMVENLLSQSRLRTGKIKNLPSPTNIETVFRLVYSLLASEAMEKQLEFVMDVGDNIPIIMVDAILLQQILTNLVSNAIKFTAKGRVVMAASIVGEGGWQLSVTDTGLGIPMPARTEIFKEFFQAEAGTVFDRPHQGNGIGLSIVKGLAEQMGGKLALQSEEGAGSIFSVTFPLALPKEITRRRK